MADDPGPLSTWLLAGGAVDTTVLVASLLLVTLTVAAGTAMRDYRWPRLEKLLTPSRRERFETLLKDEEQILDGILVTRVVASIILILALLGFFDYQGASPGMADDPGGFVGRFAIALAVFLGGIYGLVRGLARAAPERALRWLLEPAHLLSRATGPMVRAMDAIGRVGARTLGLQVEDEDDQEGAREDILDAVSDGERDGAIDDDEREMIENIIEVRDQAVYQVMTPRTRVFAVPEDMPLAELVPKVVEKGHSRIPVYRDTIDDIRGVLYAKDLLRFLGSEEGGSPVTAGATMRPALFIPETKKTSDLLEEFRRDKVHMAVVVDEYGGTAGVVTIEDIIEEIIGDIEDEYDQPEGDRQPLVLLEDQRGAEVSAVVHIDELNDALNLELPEDEGYDTVGGFLFQRMGRVPGTGESCEFDNVRFEIIKADERRIHSIRVTVASE